MHKGKDDDIRGRDYLSVYIAFLCVEFGIVCVYKAPVKVNTYLHAVFVGAYEVFNCFSREGLCFCYHVCIKSEKSLVKRSPVF